MTLSNLKIKKVIIFLAIFTIITGCVRTDRRENITQTITEIVPEATEVPVILPTLSAAEKDPVRKRRPKFMPGELVDYTAMDGDTLPALVARFNTTENEIRAANPILPEHITTLPQGLPMQIPIYYRSGWGSSFKILADAQYVNGPADKGFSARSYTDRQPGWFKYYNTWADSRNLRGGELIDYIAEVYSISPRLILAILQYLTNALTDPKYRDDFNSVLFLQSRKFPRI